MKYLKQIFIIILFAFIVQNISGQDKFKIKKINEEKDFNIKYTNLSSSHFVNTIDTIILDINASKAELLKVIRDDTKIKDTHINNILDITDILGFKVKDGYKKRYFVAIDKKKFFSNFVKTIIYDIRLNLLKTLIYTKKKDYKSISKNYYKYYKSIYTKKNTIKNIKFNQKDTLLVSLEKIQTDLEKQKKDMSIKQKWQCAIHETIIKFEDEKSISDKTVYYVTKQVYKTLNYSNKISQNLDKTNYLLNVDKENLKVEIQNKKKEVIFKKKFNTFEKTSVFIKFTKIKRTTNIIKNIIFYKDSKRIVVTEYKDSYSIYKAKYGKYYFKVDLAEPSYIYLFMYSPDDDSHNKVLLLLYPFYEEENHSFGIGTHEFCKKYEIVLSKTTNKKEENVYLTIIATKNKINNIFSLSERIDKPQLIEKIIDKENCKKLINIINNTTDVYSKTVIFRLK